MGRNNYTNNNIPCLVVDCHRMGYSGNNVSEVPQVFLPFHPSYFRFLELHQEEPRVKHKTYYSYLMVQLLQLTITDFFCMASEY